MYASQLSAFEASPRAPRPSTIAAHVVKLVLALSLALGLAACGGAQKASTAADSSCCAGKSDAEACEKCKIARAERKKDCADCNKGEDGKGGKDCADCKGAKKDCPDCKDGKPCAHCAAKKKDCPECKDGKPCAHCAAKKKDCDKKDCAKKDCAKKDCAKKDCDKKDCAKKDCDKKDCDKKDCAKKDCDKKDCHKKGDAAGFTLVPGEAFAEQIKAGTAGTIYDVNSRDRYLEGHLPGAVHVSHVALVRSDLPADKAAKIAFYCGSPKCMASHKAAAKAVDYGHTNVVVMSDGIKGWEAKGLPTEKGGTPMAFGIINAADLHQKMQGAAQVHVFDVNSAERYAAGHLPGAVHVSLDAFDRTALPTNKAAMAVFYCGSPKCAASHKAAKLAVAKGYTNVWVMYEGISGWESQSLPTSK